MKTIRLIELFAGYGSQAMALRNIGIDFEHYKVVEFDKFAIDSYNAVHGTNFPVTDIRDIHGSELEIIDTNHFTYLLTYSFPCTDLSVAGKMQGMSRDSGTRSGLLWEVERLLKETDNLPHFLLMENVTQVHGSDNIKDFAEWISFLDSKGYRSKWADLNAKDYGIPQNRSRCFMVSWLDPDFHFEFPTPIGCDTTMQDYLEDDVDAKYYLSGDKVDQLIDQLVELGIERERESIDLSLPTRIVKESSTITARYDAGIRNHQLEATGIAEKIKNVRIFELQLNRQDKYTNGYDYHDRLQVVRDEFSAQKRGY